MRSLLKALGIDLPKAFIHDVSSQTTVKTQTVVANRPQGLGVSLTVDTSVGCVLTVLGERASEPSGVRDC